MLYDIAPALVDHVGDVKLVVGHEMRDLLIMPGVFRLQMVTSCLPDLSRKHSGKLTEFLMFPFSRNELLGPP